MRFQPKQESQLEEERKAKLAEFAPWPRGEYDFELSESSHHVSRAGKESIRLILWVYDKTGRRQSIYVYLTEKMPHILKHAAEACGAADPYNRGELEPEDFAIGATGKVILKIDRGNEDFPDPKNAVQDFVVDSANAQPAAPRQSLRDELDDAVPF